MKTRPDWQFAPSTEPERGPRLRRLTGMGVILALLNLVVVAAAPMARMHFDVAPFSAFRVFLYAVQFGLVLAAMGLLFAIIAVFLKVAPAWKRGLAMLLLGALPLIAIVASLGPERLASPMIHDVSTDTQDPPQFDRARDLRGPQENSLDYGGAAVAEKQHAAWPDLGPVHTDLAPEPAMNRALEAVRALGWELLNADFDAGIIEAYDRTRFFGFTDDVVIRVRPAASGGGSRVDVRSVSRVGLGDAGKNAERIRRFIRTYKNL